MSDISTLTPTADPTRYSLSLYIVTYYTMTYAVKLTFPVCSASKLHQKKRVLLS